MSPLLPLTTGQFQVVFLGLGSLTFHGRAAVQEGLNTGFPIHNVLTPRLTGVRNGGRPHTINTTFTLQRILILAR